LILKKNDRILPSARRTTQTESAAMQVRFRVFRSVFQSWESLFQEVADFATKVGPERLITISHSEDKSDGVVTVWYWE
jgi:hypothetical protein